MKDGKINWKRLTIIILIPIVTLIIYLFFIKKDNIKVDEKINMYLSSSSLTVELYERKEDEYSKIKEIVRGTKVNLKEKDYKSEMELIPITIDKSIYYVKKEVLVPKIEDSVKEESVFVRTYGTLYGDIDLGTINGSTKKGDELKVIGHDKINEDGTVNIYKVLVNDVESYIYKKYVVSSLEEAVLNYEPDKYYNIHNARKDIYSGVGGSGGSLDYYPQTKPIFEDNKMPNKVYSLYLNGGSNVINNVDAYIEFAKTTKINAFVIDIKDNLSPAYKSKVYEKYSITNYNRAINSFDAYRNAVRKIKEAGFYVIGRITVFKDNYFVIDNPDVAITTKSNNTPYDNGTWPSAYSRKVWEFNVELAKEAIREMGFNEIQFDYVRFPDRIVGLEKRGALDFKNIYGEEKIQAIQKFLMYARDEIHKLNAYISADVFGESVNTYITAYGQYFPAISNVVDVISGMPYPDHFANNSYGIPIPGEEPYRVLNNWAKLVNERQKEIPSPAIVRTWILAQNTMQGYVYNSSHIEAQIKGLYDANVTGGYMTWSSSSSLQGYINRKEAYSKEY